MGRVLALVVSIALSGCAHRQALLGQQLPQGCQGDGASSERCMGWMLDRLLMTTSYQAYRDPELEAYVTDVGRRVARAAGDPGEWTFRVLDDPTPQAFANLGRIVYVHRGALAQMRDEAELAGLLAHEIAHVIAGHEREALAESGRGLARWGAEHARDLSYARDDEIQADELAVLFLFRAGYDAHGVERMLRALAAMSPRSGEGDEARHPHWTQRIARVQAITERLPEGGLRRDAELRRHLATLIVGEDPRRAAIVGRAAVFANAGIAIDLPDVKAATVNDGAVDLALAEETVVDLRIVPTSVAQWFANDREMITATHPLGEVSLLLIAKGPHAREHVRTLRMAIRRVLPAERAELRPQRLDLTTPRPLWPVDGPTGVTAQGPK